MREHGKFVALMGVIMVVIITLGIMISAGLLKIWHDRLPGSSDPAGMYFLRYYGFFLFLIPLAWAAAAGWAGSIVQSEWGVRLMRASGILVATALVLLMIVGLVLPWLSVTWSIGSQTTG